MTFHLSMSDNMAAFRNWHTATHPLTTWHECPYQPCDHMDATFRKCWSNDV